MVSSLGCEFGFPYVTRAYAMSISARSALSNRGVVRLTASHRAVGKRQPMCTYETRLQDLRVTILIHLVVSADSSRHEIITYSQSSGSM